MKKYLFLLLACATLPTMAMQIIQRKPSQQKKLNLKKIKPQIKKQNSELYPQECAPLAVLITCCRPLFTELLEDLENRKKTN